MKKEKISLKELIERNKEELLKDLEAVEKIEHKIEKKIQERHWFPIKALIILFSKNIWLADHFDRRNRV